MKKNNSPKLFAFLCVLLLSACGPASSNWQTYHSALYGFSFQYPAQAATVIGDYARFTINLPMLPASNITAKELNVTVTEGAGSCPSIYDGLKITKTISINSISFLYEHGQYPTGRTLVEWDAYSTAKNNTCVNLTLVLVPGQGGDYINTVNGFDRREETKAFQSLMLSFVWDGP